MDKITVAVIGCGRIADSAHFPALSKMKDVEIKYACDIIESKAKDKVEKSGEGKAIKAKKAAPPDPKAEAVKDLTRTTRNKTIKMTEMGRAKSGLQAIS